MIWGGLLLVPGAEAQMNFFKIGLEKKISSQDMDCNYQNEDHWKFTYNFEYPKLILTNNDNPIVAFVDEKSKNIFLTEISNQEVNNLYTQSSHDVESWRRWPIIFEKENKIYFALLLEDSRKWTSEVKVFLFDRENKKLNLEEDKVFKIGTRCHLWGIYPYKSNFMLIGNCSYICLRHIPLFLLGSPPYFQHNASFILDSNENSEKELARQSIEGQGCYSVYNQVYDISMSGMIQSAWVRNTTSVGIKHDEIIYLSTNKDGTQWSPPIELYSVKDVELINGYISVHINNLSIASYGSSSFLLWQDREKGIFFSELNNGKRIEFTQITDRKEVDFIQTLAVASTIKVTADNVGNAYVLWIQNSGRDYKLYFKARIDGQWTPEVIINQGPGHLTLPDMKADKEKNIHITYIKSVNPEKAYKTIGEIKYGCFYMKLERKDEIK